MRTCTLARHAEVHANNEPGPYLKPCMLQLHRQCFIQLAMATSNGVSSKPRFRLIYYPLRGRAELVRFIFEHLEIDYIDQRISFEEWARMKPGESSGTRQLH